MTGSPSYSYRPSTEADEPLVWRMLYEAARVAEDGRMSHESIRFDPYLAKYAKGWGKPGDLGVAAFEWGNGEAAGAVWLRLLLGVDRGDGYIDDRTPELALGVKPAHRGRGVGTELLCLLLNAARPHVPGITLTVRAANPAMRLYERVGFRRLPGELTNRVGGPSVKMFLAWK